MIASFGERIPQSPELGLHSEPPVFRYGIEYLYDDQRSLIRYKIEMNGRLAALAAFFLALLTTCWSGPACAGDDDLSFKQLRLSQLEQRIAEIKSSLEELAPISLRGGVGSIGFRSRAYEEADHDIWVEIDLGEESLIETIVLVPTVWRDTKLGFVADGFPVKFDVIVGVDGDADGEVIGSYGPQDALLPRIAPLIVPCPSPTNASWVRVAARTLSPRIWDQRYDFQLSEIFVFQGEENLALHQPVRVSEGDDTKAPSRQRQFLVDGFVPYSMDAAVGEQSIAYVSEIGVGDQPALTLDLGKVQPLNRIHLHGPDISDTVPQAVAADYAIPRHLQILGACEADFSDAQVLTDLNLRSIYEVGPIIMSRFPEVDCRYVRFVALEPYVRDGEIRAGKIVSGTQIGFAEIEIFSKGQNVALGKTFSSDFGHETIDRFWAALTDGLNFYGEVLSIRTWMNQLALRHDLEAELPVVAQEVRVRYAEQTANLRFMTWLAALLGVGIGFTWLVSRMLQMRQLSEVKERFAADLHDELGANLHTIGLLSDLADDFQDSPDELTTFLKRIRSVTERTGIAMRNCTDMHDAGELYTGFKSDMQRAAERIVVHLDHDLTIEGETYLNRLKPRTRMDLFLFYKESLVNICRHSGATELVTRLSGTPHEINLHIADNGRGIPEAGFPATESSRHGKTVVPPSLRRRARLLGATIRAESPADGGTCIHLKLQTRRWGFHR
ncbi:Signal transduction histidine kinase [Neorhodopirellula lusitana]|uniref:histidine kinase n=1 Tax=Neorhodopirellula lusitana TaxID=445327 RepID=A0ABY1QHL6_9BACT|nr:ATP-binding protein [Neorhodopirellula lusitana]SMP70834.1 Signal transduction histidine kinase [Neorhodopirellula lusitana]